MLPMSEEWVYRFDGMGEMVICGEGGRKKIEGIE